LFYLNLSLLSMNFVFDFFFFGVCKMKLFRVNFGVYFGGTFNIFYGLLMPLKEFFVTL